MKKHYSQGQRHKDSWWMCTDPCGPRCRAKPTHKRWATVMRSPPNTFLFGFVALWVGCSTLSSQTIQAPGKPDPGHSSDKEPAHPSSRRPWHRLEFGYFGGFGLHGGIEVAQVDVSYSGFMFHSTKSIKAGFGGGNGFLGTYGFSPIPYLELLGSGGWQKASLDTGIVHEMAGGFSRMCGFYSANLVLPLTPAGVRTGQGPALSFGGGLGVYDDEAELTVDSTRISGGKLGVLTYRAVNPGWHVHSSIEIKAKMIGVGARVGYYNVGYRLDKATVDDVDSPVGDIRSDLRKVRGDALNLTLYVAVFL